MLVRGDVRAVLAGVGFGVLFNLPLLLVLAGRAGGIQAFVTNLLQSQRAWQAAVDPSTQVYGVDAPGLLSRLLGARLPAAAYLGVSVTVLAAAGAAVRAVRRTEDPNAALLSGSIICVAVLLAVHHHAYDLVLLVAPVIAVVKMTLPGSFLTRRRRTALLLLFTLLGANYVTTLSVLRGLAYQQHLWLLLASLNGAFLLGIFLLYVLPVRVSTPLPASR